MVENKRNRNAEILIRAVNSLDLEFPVKEISETMGIDKGNLSSFLNGKKVVSTKFLEKFSSTYNIDLSKYNNITTKEIDDISEDPFTDALVNKLFDSKLFLGKLKEVIKTDKEDYTDEEYRSVLLRLIEQADKVKQK